MSKLREAAQQVLDAWENPNYDLMQQFKREQAIAALRAALSEEKKQQEMQYCLSPEQFQVIGVLVEGLLRAGAKISAKDPKTCLQSMPDGSINCGLDICYASPPKREWVGLTDAEIREAYPLVSNRPVTDFARAIEAKLKEKNHG